MEVSMRPKGHEDYFTVQVEGTEEESDTVIAHRAIHEHDRGGNGKIKVRGWTYGYEFGTLRRPRHC